MLPSHQSQRVLISLTRVWMFCFHSIIWLNDSPLIIGAVLTLPPLSISSKKALFYSCSHKNRQSHRVRENKHRYNPLVWDFIDDLVNPPVWLVMYHQRFSMLKISFLISQEWSEWSVIWQELVSLNWLYMQITSRNAFIQVWCELIISFKLCLSEWLIFNCFF